MFNTDQQSTNINPLYRQRSFAMPMIQSPMSNTNMSPMPMITRPLSMSVGQTGLNTNMTDRFMQNRYRKEIGGSL